MSSDADQRRGFFATSGSRALPLIESLKRRDVRFSPHRVRTFPNANQWVETEARVAERCTVIWSPSASVGDSLVELALLADALRRSGSRSTTCVIPYLDYSRSDRTEGPGTALGAKVFADLLCAADVDRFVVFSLHTPAVVGCFQKPVFEIDAADAVIEHLASRRFDTVVAPDGGRYREAHRVAERLGAGLELLLKTRTDHALHSRLSPALGSPERFRGANVLVFDDEILTGSTLVNALGFIARGEPASVEVATLYPVCEPSVLSHLFENTVARRVTLTNLGRCAGFAAEQRVGVVDLSGRLLETLDAVA